MLGSQQRQQVVDRGADLAQVALDVGEGGRADRDDDVVGLRCVGGAGAELEPAAGQHALEQLLGAGLAERHPAGPDRLEDRRVVVDAEHPQPAVGERQREREPDPAEPDDGDVTRGAHASVTLRSGASPGSAACPRISPLRAI